ncbi:hypothetical protein DUT90_12310 [Polaribacter sp. WD7]|uniref:hypothetical protein n=1 Tax=Polaribacter sp. WD7 TaxID=2269061 RepID=UPI000DF2648B|nr:hypothetical protein [Polaribacter sp. WD7]RCS26533.1 hypothetical protein DUT90_12310 [Polaribacter sp. WD7]
MNIIEAKVLKAIENNKLNPEILGERNWCKYFIRTTELVWSRNFFDGYLIEVYTQDKQHLCTLKV